MKKEQISTKEAPGAIGPYSQGIAAGPFVFTSGQLPLNAATGALESADISAATRLCLTNVEAILRAAGCTLADIVKTTVFLVDLSDFAAVNEAYAAFFKEAPPARSCVQVAALPKAACIEIEAVAVRREA